MYESPPSLESDGAGLGLVIVSVSVCADRWQFCSCVSVRGCEVCLADCHAIRPWTLPAGKAFVD